MEKSTVKTSVPYAEEKEFEHLMQCVDHSVSRETFSLYKDPENDLLLTWPQPDAEQLPSYYESEDYISHTDSRKSAMDKVYQLVKKFALKNKLGLISRAFDKSPGKLLDVGCGTGDFLSTCKDAGWQVVGVEPNEKARSMAEDKISGPEPLFDTIEKVKTGVSQKFDVITMWHVLEHVPDLSKYIESLRDLLGPKGVLCVAVPNHKSYDASHYGPFWAAYDVPRHLWHFSRKSVQEIFESHGMEIVKELPMLFDSFYVSMLSEKYKRGKTALLPAFYHGLLSNLRAGSNGEYSSIIYLIKKAK